MATMKETKKRLAEASELDKIKIIKDGDDKIVIDLNGDNAPEAALIDTTGNGEPDLLALDLTGDHKFNLYLDDTDDNNYPDVAYIDKKGDGNIQLLSVGEDVEGKYHEKLVRIYGILTDDEASAEDLSDALHDLAKTVREIKAKIHK